MQTFVLHNRLNQPLYRTHLTGLGFFREPEPTIAPGATVEWQSTDVGTVIYRIGSPQQGQPRDEQFSLIWHIDKQGEFQPSVLFAAQAVRVTHQVSNNQIVFDIAPPASRIQLPPKPHSRTYRPPTTASPPTPPPAYVPPSPPPLVYAPPPQWQPVSPVKVPIRRVVFRATLVTAAMLIAIILLIASLGVVNWPPGKNTSNHFPDPPNVPTITPTWTYTPTVTLTPTMVPLVVQNVTATGPGNFRSTNCLENQPFTFSGAIATNASGGGTVTYHWLRSDSTTSLNQTVNIAAGEQHATVADDNTWQLSYKLATGATFSDTLVVTAPNQLAAKPAQFTYRCDPGIVSITKATINCGAAFQGNFQFTLAHSPNFPNTTPLDVVIAYQDINSGARTPTPSPLSQKITVKPGKSEEVIIVPADLQYDDFKLNSIKVTEPGTQNTLTQSFDLPATSCYIPTTIGLLSRDPSPR